MLCDIRLLHTVNYGETEILLFIWGKTKRNNM